LTLHFEKYLVPVQKQQKQPSHHQGSECQNHRFESLCMFSDTVNKIIRDRIKVHKALNAVYRDGIHSYHNEKKCPGFVAFDVDNPVK
jgi:hypothetical protein